MKKILFLCLALLLCIGASAQRKQDLKVLYVGGSPDFDQIGAMKKPDSLAVEKSAAKRTALFSKMLKRYFRTVKAIHARDYRQAMSDDYDVTIFDGRIPALREHEYVRDANGRVTGVIPAAYLTPDYDRPTLTIAEQGYDLGRSIGIKTDWYCLCLYNDAHSWKRDHAIFQGPFPVKLDVFKAPTHVNAKEIGTMFGQQLPDSLDMWRVQRSTDKPEGRMRIGMVSRPDGFGDPDDEVISSGVCAKSIDAVALGRHANFFHWGFSASPADMTEQAKAVFANAIVYISRFAGRPIARKMDDRISTRHWLHAKKYTDSHEGYEANNRSNAQFNAMVDSVKQVAKAKQAKGEALNEMEQIYANFRLQPMPTFEEYMRQREPDLFHYFGTDSESYARYYEKNMPYFYYFADKDKIDIDEDARALGIANSDPRLLDAAIALWEKGEQQERARRILTRYTLCRFETAAEWRAWFNTYRDRLFFTEGSGFLFLVNSTDPAVPGNDYSVLQAAKPTAAPAVKGETDDKNPVLINAVINRTDNGEHELVVNITIHPGYHIYAQVADEEPFLNTEFNLTLPDGLQQDGRMTLPAFKPLGDKGTMGYEGRCIFRQRISGQGTGEARLTINYQCCDNNICFPPAEKVITMEVK